MSARLKWTPEKIEQLHALVEAGKTRPEIARVLNESYDSVVSALLYHKVPHKLATTRWTDEAIDDVFKKLAAGLTVSEVAAMIEVHPGTLQSILQQRAADRLRQTTYQDKMRRIVAKRRRLAALNKPKKDYRTSERFRDQLTLQVRSMIPRGLHEFMRDDIQQEVILAVLEGAVLTKLLVDAKIRQVYRDYPLDHIVSLDAPAPGDDRPLYHFIPSTIWEDYL